MRSRLRFGAAAMVVLLTARCASPSLLTSGTSEWEISDDLTVRRLADGVWLHTSWRRLENGTRFPSNGLLVRDGRGVMLVDTAWGEEPTAGLLRWIDGTLRLPVTRAVITHSHDDRIGGASLLVARRVPLYSHPLTVELARASGFPVPGAITAIAEVGMAATVGPVEVFYPGPAHARDNIVVWLPRQRILFGGCAIRALDTTSLGNVADADMKAWPRSARRVKQRYGDASIFVPGHGEPGNADLLQHTLDLFNTRRATDD